jgi:hypothetical protein
VSEVCGCGCPVGRVEVRVISRCTRGHWVKNGTAAAVLEAAAAPEPISPGQIRALNAKWNALDKAKPLDGMTWKQHTLDQGGVSSTKDLTSTGASELLDWLERELGGSR